MRKVNVAILLIMSLLLSSVLFGCNEGSNSTNEPDNVDTGTTTNVNDGDESEPEKEKSMVIGSFWLGSDADPANGWNGWTLTRTLTGENLATVDENMNIIPQLADSWEKIDDLTWKFHIRQGVKFSNGKDLTPEAVKSSLERTIDLDERAKAASKMESITVDGENIIYKTTTPYGSLLANLTEPLFIIIDTDVDESIIKTAPVTTAPYKILAYDAETGFEAEANELYWGGKPGLDKYTVKLIKDNSTRALAMQSGEIDLTFRLDGPSIETLKADGNFNVYEVPSIRTEYLCINHTKEELKDLNIRKALSYGIDRENAAKLQKGAAVGAIFPESAGFGYDKLNLQTFDKEMAKKALKDSGYEDTDNDGIVDKNGKKLSFVLHAVAKNSSLAEIIQAQLKEVGIDIQIQIVEDFTSVIEDQSFDLLLQSYATATTGDSKRFLEQNYSTNGTDNFGKYSNLEFDSVVEKLISEFDLQKRKEITIEAQQIANDDYANIFLVSSKANIVTSKRVKNVKVFPIDYYILTMGTTVEE